MAKSVPNEKISQYKDGIFEAAEELVHKNFPQTVVELDSLLKDDLFDLNNLEDVVVDLNIPIPDPIVFNSNSELPSKKRKITELEDSIQGSKVFLLPEGLIPCNKKIVVMSEKIKPFVRSLVMKCNTLKMWVALRIPKIEDGNNFGVSVQEDILAECRQVETEAASYLDQITRYFVNRAKVVCKVAKYPHVEDYRRTVSEIDEKQFLSLRLVLCELRNHYSSLHDMITKNIDKIRKPRGASAAETMY